MHVYERSKRKRQWWKPALFTLVVAALLVIYFKNRPANRTFSAFEMHGGPVVLSTGTNPTVIALTSHWERRAFTTGRYTLSTIVTNNLHWDVWSLNATDLSRKWVTRLASIKRAERALDAGILGVVDGTIWMIADGLMAVSATDGRVLGDAAAIEARNPALSGMMPTSKRHMYFENGLVLVAGDGQRWRIDGQTLLARAENAAPTNRGSVMEFAGAHASDSGSFVPLRLSSQYQSYKSRDYVVGDTWYGMMHPSEIDRQRRDPHTQDFGQALRYKLWYSPLRDTVNRFRDPIRAPWEFAPRAESPDFLLGGLLTIPDRKGKDGVVGIANPTRFLVLHQNRVDNDAKQTLTCVGLDGRVCWNAPLEVSLATAFAIMSNGGPEKWALIVAGITRPTGTDTLLDLHRDGLPSVSRVAISDGTVLHLRFADVDLAKLSDELKPYRKR